MAWHLGQVTRILPLPLGTESIWPQLGHLRYAVVLRPFHIFLAVRLARSKSSLLVPAAREVLADSRTMKGGGAAGVATLGAAGVEVAQSVLAETQTAILPLVPYLDTLRWVFIAVALAGIAVTIYARLDDWKKGLR